MPNLDENGNPIPGSGTATNPDNAAAATASVNIKKQLLPSKYDGSRYYSNANMKPQWIVIHNVGPGSASACYNTFNDPGGRNVSTHFTCDDKEIIQMLEVSWKGIHTNGNAMSKGGCSEWAGGKAPAVPCGANNSNSIGIEVGNNGGGVTSVNEAKALEVAIELTRYLMKELNIDADHVVRHGDTQPKNCPSSIMKNGGENWVYFKEQLKTRNEQNKPIDLSTSNISVQPGNNMGSPNTGGGGGAIQLSTGGYGTTLLDTPLYASPTDIEVQLPDVDHRENTTNMDEVTGVSLIFYPPYNSCEAENRENYFTELKYDRTYHYVIGKGYESKTPEGGTEVEGSDTPEAEPTMFMSRIMPRSKYVAYVGDSLTKGMGNAMPNLTVYATEGHTVGQGYSAYADKIVADKPLVVVMCYGTNDAVNGSGGINKFKTDYKKFIKHLKDNIPNVQIFINTIPPGDSSKATNSGYKTAIQNIPSYNAVLSEIAAEGATVIDATNGITGDSYSSDGLHMTKQGYEDWHEAIEGQINKDSNPDDDEEPGTGTNPGGGGEAPPLVLPEGDPVGGDKDLESANGFAIKAWIDEKKQSQGFTDNDTHTYIDRALFKSKKEKHNLTVALMCPMPEKDPETGKYKPDSVDYPAYEKALIEGLAIILHEHGLEVKDLWREFDLNRAPSPFLYLERDAWKDLLTEVEKQLNWRIAKYGAYTKTFTKYSAGSSGLSGGSTGSIGAGTINGGGGSPGGGSPGTGPDIGNISDNAQAAWTYFTGAGFTPQCAAGIMGNLQQESGIEPTKEQYGGGPGRGIGQWTVSEERFAGLKAHASSKGKDWTDLQSQLEWVDLELQGKDSSTLSHLKRLCGGYDAFKQLTDLRRACDIFEQAFERAGKPMMANRYKYAEQFYSKFSTSSGGTGGGTLPPLEEASLEPVLFANKPQARTGTVYGWPVPGVSKVSSKFGPRTPPCKGASSMHGGIDIGAASGTPIMSYAAGTVVQNVAWNKSAGNYIKIDHGTNENGEKVESRYLHMVEPSPLAVGTTVTAGQQVGKVGNTGVGTGAHLHFEIHINGTKVDPLKYVNPGGGTVGNPTVTPGAGGTGGGIISTPTIGGGGGGGTIGNPSSGLLYDDIKQPLTNGVIEGNSAGGQNHDDWGGVMTYKKGSPTDESAEQPEIITIITKEMYADLIEYSDPKIVDDYVMDFEPYSKGLASVDDNQIDISDRISAMTKQFITRNENTFHYKVIESGPGSKDHCVTVAEELNYLAVPQDLKVEPIYPDLVIPPGYISTEADKASPNSIPVAVVQEGGITSSDSYTKQLSFDYDLLKEQVKLSNKRHHPINYTDPYPYDEKITDLERHYPKVFIDEIEGQLYSCNHPGCPISQPMAKNFAMVSDAMMNQSKRIEKRLSRIENILATIIRNQGRLGARMNINCVYYGGHSTFGKYKCIRCLHDDRINDGQLVTVDQCLNCTRFEPILGQVYRILDDSGLNGSIILDDMQMSYTDLEGFRNLNDITHRSSKYFNAKATEEKNCVKPTQTLIDMYKFADKEQAIEQIRKESTDESEAQKKIDELKEEDYIFKMDWAETFFNSQEPDTKLYPNEGIVARSKVNLEGDGPHTLEDEIAELDPTMDADVIEELKEQIRIRDNIWVDTRNTSDAIQTNKYSSENYFFEDFNKVRIGKYGIKFSALYNYNGEDYNNVYSGSGGGGAPGSQIDLLNGSNPGSAFASQVRDKIVEMAKKILQDCNDGKAWYSQPYRTTEYDKPVTIQSGNGAGKTGYDCTSFVSCCYMYAGLKSMYAKSCSGGTLVREIQKGGKMIPCNSENMQYILPGDILLTASGTVTQNQCNQLAFITTSHAAIYVGNNQIIHARGKNYGIQASNMDYYLTKGNYVFVRPADLLEADKVAAQQQQTNTGGGGGVEETPGTINGMNYVAKIPQAVITAYSGDGQGANGPLVYNSHCASHNLPYGTKIYIPGLAGKAGSGIFTVQDTGGCFFDFDIYTTTWSGKQNMDAYIIEFGSSSKISKSYTWAMDLYNSRGTWDKLKSAWVTYKNMNGKLVNYWKYDSTDQNIKNHPNYNS